MLCAAHFVTRTLGILRGPHDGDLYAYSWSFQAVVFAIFRFPFWLIGALVAFLAERSYFVRRTPKRELG